MSMLIFIASFLGMVILVPAIWYGFFRLGIFLRANILAQGKFIYTLIHFQHLDSKPQLMDNPNFLKTGKWDISQKLIITRDFQNFQTVTCGFGYKTNTNSNLNKLLLLYQKA